MNEFTNVLLSAWTVVVAIIFIGIAAWAWSARRRPEFDAAARLPLEPDLDDRIPEP
ncbi:MAG: cbb3-type cytochrome c oxidase subunit 3 [Gammaproteobacteria bacterium]|nr:cbb3-type cytochrome c oxidase subunit 3 [Gammaproteobacteria bacterium]